MQIAIANIIYHPLAETSRLTKMKYHIFLGLFAVAAAYPGFIHEEAPQIDHQALISESGHHHQIQHEHAKSHQSIKFEHFHPVPVYIKKEHSHLLKHPLEKGQSESNLKQIHPETQQAHGHGLVLEDHRLNTDHHAGLGHGGFEHGGLEHAGFEHGGLEHGGLSGGLEHEGISGGLEHGGVSQGIEHGGYQHGGYEQFAGGYESGEGLKAYAESHQPEIQGHYYGEQSQGLGGSEEGHNYGHY
ncbi:glycine-rich cell wall structural protein [Colias croceus]|uniref:glycine-rich cell wall structural protein n=1 Tax=Colias crocea TaxID=72248 RepID=UPI001E27B134|nr:glycine-rich cell wall structural protein [Colias croceus]